MAEHVAIKKIMSTHVITGSKDDTISSTAHKMKKYKIGVIVITTPKGKVQGLISERDIINKVVANGLEPDKTFVKDIMTKKVTTASPNMTDVKAAAILAKKDVKKLPVIYKGKVVGILTQTDLLKFAFIKWAV